MRDGSWGQHWSDTEGPTASLGFCLLDYWHAEQGRISKQEWEHDSLGLGLLLTSHEPPKAEALWMHGRALQNVHITHSIALLNFKMV